MSSRFPWGDSWWGWLYRRPNQLSPHRNQITWAFIINSKLLRVNSLTAKLMFKNMFLNLLHFMSAVKQNLIDIVVMVLMFSYWRIIILITTNSNSRFPIFFQSGGCICLSVMTVRLKSVNNYVHLHVDGVFCHFIQACTWLMYVVIIVVLFSLCTCSHYKRNS